MAAHKLPCATSKGCFLIPNSLFYSPISNFLFSIYQVFKEAISRYLREHGYDNIRLKAVLFDMDGVLFNSMPYHADAWHTVMERHGLHLSREEAYMHEGRTGAATINIVYQRQYGKDATPEMIESIYAEKAKNSTDIPNRTYARSMGSVTENKSGRADSRIGNRFRPALPAGQTGA